MLDPNDDPLPVAETEADLALPRQGLKSSALSGSKEQRHKLRARHSPVLPADNLFVTRHTNTECLPLAIYDVGYKIEISRDGPVCI